MAMYSFFVARVFSVRGAQEEEKIERERERERMQVKHAGYGNTYSTKLGATDVK